MLLSIVNLSSCKIESKEGNIGHIHSFLFDDHSWTIRYLIVDTGHWLPGRKVLLSPEVLGEVKEFKNTLHIELTMDQIRNSPDIDTEKSVSRQHEIELHRYYNWVPYWTGSFGTETIPYAPTDLEINEDIKQQQKSEEETESHLRDTDEVTGYKIHANDGQIGHLDDFIISRDGWKIRYIVVDTSKWLLDRKVIIPPDWIKEIDWATSEVVVDVSKDAVKDSPGFNPAEPVNREYESQLYDYYGRPRYWV